jgi:hypothetical protein
MNRLLLAALVATPLALPAWSLAQQGASSAPKAGAKPQVKRIADRPTRQAAPPPAPVEIDLPPAEGEQNAAASMAHYGNYQCEFNQTLVVGMNPKHDGYLDVRFGNRTYTMKPVLSHTGALRLEDVRGQMLVVQIATKSMMLDTKAGRRVVDDCKHDNQVAAAASMASAPGIGIDPNRPVATPAAPAAPAVASTEPAPAAR